MRSRKILILILFWCNIKSLPNITAFITSLRLRFLLTIFLVFLPAFGFTIVNQVNARREGIALAEERVSKIAEAAHLNNENMVHGTRMVLVSLAHLPQVKEDRAGECSQLLAGEMKHYPYYINLGATSKDGSIYCSAVPVLGMNHIEGRSDFVGARANLGFSIGEYRTAVNGQHAIDFSYPIQAEDGTFNGVVFASVDLNWIKRAIEESIGPNNIADTVFGVIDRQGTILARVPETGEWIGKTFPDAPLVKTILSQQKGLTETDGLDGINRLYAIYPVNDDQGPAFYLSAGFPKKAVLGPIETGYTHQLALLFGLAVLSIGSAWLFTESKVLRNVQAMMATSLGIEEARDYYLTLFQEFPALIWRAGLDTKCDYFNKTWLSFTGRTMEQEMGNGWAEGVHPDDFERCLKTYLESFAARQSFEMEYRLRRHDGEYRWLTDIGRPFYGLDGEFAGYIGTCFDITDRKNNEQALLESEERYRQLIELSPDTIFVQHDERIIYTNHASVKLFGADNTSQLVGQKVLDLIHPDYRETVHARMGLITEQHVAVPQLEEKILRLDGSSVDVEVIASPITYNHKRAAQVILRDITERRKAEMVMQELAYRDPLTNLYNRKAFQDELEERLCKVRRTQKQLAIFFMDMDHFKTVNDTYGHDVGDAVLVEVANRLRNVVRSDDTACRMGGDEFILLSEVGGRADAERICDRILMAFEAPFHCKEYLLPVSISIGISVFPDNGGDPETLIQQADHAMYRVKRSRND